MIYPKFSSLQSYHFILHQNKFHRQYTHARKHTHTNKHIRARIQSRPFPRSQSDKVESSVLNIKKRTEILSYLSVNDERISRLSTLIKYPRWKRVLKSFLKLIGFLCSYNERHLKLKASLFFGLLLLIEKNFCKKKSKRLYSIIYSRILFLSL